LPKVIIFSPTQQSPNLHCQWAGAPGALLFLVTRSVRSAIMRPIIPVTVPTISAVVKLLLFDEVEEPVAALEVGELVVGDLRE
jgi:hypothetical protein